MVAIAHGDNPVTTHKFYMGPSRHNIEIQKYFMNLTPKHIALLMEDVMPPRPQQLQVSKEWWGTEAAGTVAQVIEYLQTQPPDADCIASVTIKEPRGLR